MIVRPKFELTYHKITVRHFRQYSYLVIIYLSEPSWTQGQQQGVPNKNRTH